MTQPTTAANPCTPLAVAAGRNHQHHEPPPHRHPHKRDVPGLALVKGRIGRKTGKARQHTCVYQYVPRNRQDTFSNPTSADTISTSLNTALHLSSPTSAPHVTSTNSTYPQPISSETTAPHQRPISNRYLHLYSTQHAHQPHISPLWQSPPTATTTPRPAAVIDPRYVRHLALTAIISLYTTLYSTYTLSDIYPSQDIPPIR